VAQVANLRHVPVRAGEADLASKIGRGAADIFSAQPDSTLRSRKQRLQEQKQALSY